MGSAGLAWVLTQTTHNDSSDGDGGFDEFHGLVSNGSGSVMPSGRLDGDATQLIPDHVMQSVI